MKRNKTIITIMAFFAVLVACQSKTGKNTQNTVNDTINIKQSTENRYEKINIDSIPQSELIALKKRWIKEDRYDRELMLYREMLDDKEYKEIYKRLAPSMEITIQDMTDNSKLYFEFLTKKYNLTVVDDSTYRQRILELFSIDVNDEKYQPNKYKRYFSEFVIQKLYEETDPSYEGDWFTHNLFLCKKDKFILFNVSLLQDMMNLIINDNELATQDEHDDKYYAELLDKGYFVIDKDVLKLQYHINNYVLHNSQASLTWLIFYKKDQDAKGIYRTEFISELFYKFGYDKDPRINQFILKDIDLSSDYCDKDLFEGHLHIYANLFALKPFYSNTMKLRENLMKYVVDEVNENNCNLLKTLDYFGLSVCDGDKSTDAEEIAIDNYTQTERYKMAAYAGYYLYKGRQKLISANSALDSCYKNNFLTIELCGYKENELPKRYRFLFLDVNHMPRERSRNEDFIKALRDNNYYDLPGFKEIVEKIIGNE